MEIVKEWLGAAVAISLSAVGVIYKFGRQDNKIESHGKQLDELHTLIEGFHGKCNTMNDAIGKVVTYDNLKDYCHEHQSVCSTAVCRKIDEIKGALKKTDATVELNRKTTTEALTRIERFMGAIEERNKLIDLERGNRRETDR